MDRKKKIQERFLNQLLATPRGRAHVLAQAADAEANGEGGFFDVVLARVDDPELGRLVRRHRDDEVRHAAMFHERAVAQGVPVPAVPAELKVIERLDRAVGSLFDREIKDRTGIMEAYLLLQVVEERAVTQFGLLEPPFRRVDPATAGVIAQVRRDEERHLKYCHAIARRYAPDEFTHARTLRRYRTIEAQVYADVARANMRHALEHGLLEAGPLARLGWRALALLNALVGAPDPTPFVAAPAAAAA